MNLINNSLLAYYVRRARRSTWTPAALFAEGQQGAWYEPKPQYLFQDAAGTVPVTADGDPVGYMQDLSGNGNHATQSTSAARPIYRTDGTLHWLKFDGVDDGLQTGVIDYSSASSITVMAPVYKGRTDSAILTESGPVGANTGGYLFGLGSFSSSQDVFGVNGATGDIVRSGENVVEEIAIWTGRGSISSGLREIRKNASTLNTTTVPATPDVLGNRNLNIGARGQSSLFLKGRIFGLVIVTSADEGVYQLGEPYLAELAGVQL